MAGYWVLKYSKNEDTTLVEYKTIEDSKTTNLPAMSICLISGDGNETSHHHDASYFLEYIDNITISLRKSFKQKICTVPRQCKFVTFKSKFNGTISYVFTRCFEIRIDTKYSKYVDGITMNFNDTFGTFLSQIELAFVHFHYPGQLFLAFRSDEFLWTNRKNITEFMAFSIHTIEVLRRRSKPNEKCLKDSISYDQLKMKHIIDKLGCKTPHHKFHLNYPVCADNEELRSFDGSQLRLAKFSFPCEEISHVSVKLLHHNSNFGYGLYPFHVSYPDKMKIITQNQAIDIHALIGNIGGYIGLFLGTFKI